MHCTYGPSLLWADFIMCQVNLNDHDLFSAVSYILVDVVALLFYVHGKHLRSCQDGQLT